MIPCKRTKLLVESARAGFIQWSMAEQSIKEDMEHVPYVVFRKGDYRLVRLCHGEFVAEWKTTDLLGAESWVYADRDDDARTRALIDEAVLEFAKRLGIGPDSPFEEEK